MKPIRIHKGDSTIFANANKFLTFNIDTELDLTGYSAKFILCSILKTVSDISSRKFDIILGSDETQKLRDGLNYGSIILTDNKGNSKTLINTIPFDITTAVVENEYQEIDLTIPQSSGVDIKLKVGVSSVTSVNGMIGDVVLDIPSIEGLATEQQLRQGLNTKQDKGDYALVEQLPTLVSELENDSQFATQTQVMQAIASIPQFKLSIVDKLPSTGEKMTLYLVPKEGTNNDVYDEYIWIEQTSSFEHLGTTAVDLTDYIKKTDYATDGADGIVKVKRVYGLASDGSIGLRGATTTLDGYKTVSTQYIIAKGTLDAVLTQYSKTVLTTEADYNALETKDANTLYLIEE